MCSRLGHRPTLEKPATAQARESEVNVSIVFYRIRKSDQARAVIAQHAVEADDLQIAIQVARQLVKTLEMPQEPDAIAILDEQGDELCSHRFSKLIGNPPSAGATEPT